MATLGIQINANLITGRITSYTKNDGSWTRKISDDRDNITMFSGVTNQDTLICLRYIEEGVLIRVIVPKFGRGQNASVAADIFIPSDVVVPGGALVKMIDVVAAEMHNEQLNTQLLNDIFNEEFEMRMATHQISPANNEKIAVREYGDGTVLFYQLPKLLDSKYIYQPQYMSYQYVFFIDKSKQIGTGGLHKLDDIQLIESVEFNPIKPIDGFTPYIGENIFRNPICVYQGEKVTITWKKEGYRDIVKKYTINKTCNLPAIEQSEYERLIDYSLIDVRDFNTRKPVERYDLIINGKRLNPDDQVAVSEDKLKDTEIKVYADGYNNYVSVHDVTRRVTVCLKAKTYTYDFSVEDSIGESPVKFKIESYGRLNHSPLKGYDIYRGGRPSENHNNLLIYNPYNKAEKCKHWIIRLICFVVGLVLGVVGVAYVANKTIENLESQLSSAKKGHTTYTTPTQQETPKKENDPYADIIKYMDTSVKWNKLDLDKHPQIHGLWDALNEYKFDEIKRFKEPLKESTKFTELISAIEKDNKTRVDYGESYNTKEDDLDITIDNYIKKIQSEKQSKPAPTPKPAEKKEDSPSKSKGWMKK